MAKTFFSCQSSYIYTDSPDVTKYRKPPHVGGYLPDLYAKLNDSDGIVLGEAKTHWDIQNRHCRDQWTAFMRECSKEEKSIFVIEVPWDMVPTAKTVVRSINCEEDLRQVSVEFIQGLRV